MQHGCIIFAEEPGALIEVCGISVVERLLRTLQRCGISRAIVVSTDAERLRQKVGPTASARDGLQLAFVDSSNLADELARETANLWLVLRGDTIFDPRLLNALLAENHPVALVDSRATGRLCGAALASREAVVRNPRVELARDESPNQLDVAQLPIYSPVLRRNLRPFWFSPEAIRDKETVEHALVEATQKGAQDFPAMLHAPIEKFLVSRLCRTQVTPHQLTFAWIILACVVTALFALGHLAWGIALAFAIGILDGLDGKLARLRVETSSIGKLEHQADSFFEVGWPVALAWHFYHSSQLPHAFAYLLLLVAGQIVDGLCKSVIYNAFAASGREPDFYDRVVRFFGGRRNVCVWILLAGVLLGAPVDAFIVMAWWQVATALFDLPHAIWLRAGSSR